MTINSNVDAGSAYVVFGKASGWPGSAQALNAAFLNGTNGVEYDGPAANDSAGASVASGDYNGDGISDIAIAAPNSGNNPGADYILFGQKSGWSGSATLLDATLLNGITGVEVDDPPSADVGTANNEGDGEFTMLSDARAYRVIISDGGSGSGGGSGSSSGGGSGSGSGSGSSSGGGSLATPTMAIGSLNSDLNGDGIADIVVGSPGITSSSHANAGAVYVLFGHKNTTAWTTPYSLTGL
jgi:hypothetical protein